MRWLSKSKTMNKFKNAVVLLCTPVALCFVGLGYLLMALGVPVVNDAAVIIKNFTEDNNG